MLNGIDISHHNTDQIKRDALVPEDHDFVLMKATEGKSYVDPMLYPYLSMIDQERQGFGFYHYCWPAFRSKRPPPYATFVARNSALPSHMETYVII